jgi:hypothetical protein
MSCVIEIQGYTNSERTLIPKEIVLCADTKTTKYLIKPQKNLCEFNKKDRCLIGWATNKYHHIPWNSGDTHLDEIAYLIYFEAQQYEKIYTKGRAKAIYLTNLLARKVEDLSDLGCPSLKEDKSTHVNSIQNKQHTAPTPTQSFCNNG